MGEAFWSSQSYYDVLYISALIGWGIGIVLPLLAPGLAAVVLSSYMHSRTERIGTYISRFIPYPLYSRLLDLATALLSGTIGLSLVVRLEIVPTTLGAGSYLTLFGLGVLLSLVLSAGRYLFFGLWRYVFIPHDAAETLRQDFFVLTQIRLTLLLPLVLLFLSPLPTEVCLWSGVGILASIQLLRMIQCIRRLWPTEGAHVYLFLYLCTHEIVPWLYVAALFAHVLEVDFLQQIYK